LSEGKTFDVILSADPTSLFDQVLLHVSGQGDWPTEANRSQPQEIADELVK
jgi:hypothetical protein